MPYVWTFCDRLVADILEGSFFRSDFHRIDGDMDFDSICRISRITFVDAL